MLRRYTLEQASEKLGLDDAEIRFLMHHFREFLSAPREGQQQRDLTDQDIVLLARIYKLHYTDGRDPAEVRSLLRDESTGQRMLGRRQAEMLAFVSGRPATGISSLVFNLASVLTARGYRCTIFDGSTDGGGVFHSVQQQGDVNEWDLLLENGVRIISGEKLLENELVDLAGESTVRLELISTSSDYVLVDSGEGKSDTALRYAMVVDETIAITNPDVGANADCFSIVRMLRDVDPDLRLGVVVNRALGLGDARESFARMNGAAQKVNLGELPGLGWVAEDEALRKCMANGEAIVDVLPTSISSRCIGRLADYLTNRLTPVQRRSSGGLVSLVRALQSARQRGGHTSTLS